MGCSGDREKGHLDESQKWDYVTLSDFRASGALTYLSYGWLWFMALIAVAVYGADTFTAINLLAYDKWSSQIEPSIPLKYSKWIFAACIMFSWVLCIFEWVRATRVVRRGSVAESYMDSVAVTLQSMRPNGWKRFLVFAELTKSKKGVDYVALFVYFAFKGAVRIIFAEGPRQVVNAITLYSFMQQDLIPMGDHAATQNRSSFEQFWVNVETLAESNREQAVVLFTMLFTLVIWVISALCLIIAVVLYLVFLWHYIPQSDGRLSNYCRRKIDRRLEKVVSQKVKQALEDQENKHAQSEAKAAKKVGQLPNRPQVNRKPTLPQVAAQTPDIGRDSDFGLVRQDTHMTQKSAPSRTNTTPLFGLQRQNTLPEDHPALPPAPAPEPALRRQQTPLGIQQMQQPPRTHTAPPMAMYREPSLPDLDAERRPPMPYRSDTEASAMSNATYASDASLLGNANDMGSVDSSDYYSTQSRPTFDRSTSHASRQMPPTFDAHSGYASQPYPSRSATAAPQQPARWGHHELDETFEYERDMTQEPMDRYASPYPQDMSMHQANMGYEDTINMPRQRPQQSFQQSYAPLARMSSGLSFASRHTPEPEMQSFEMTTQTRTAMPEPFERRTSPPQQQSHQPRSASAASGGYVAFNPSFTLAAAAPSFMPPNRSITSPPEISRPATSAGPQRSATAPPEAYDGLIDEYRQGMQPQYARREFPGRSATAGPGQRRPEAPVRSASTAPHHHHDIPGRSATAAPGQKYSTIPEW
ncbi:hypothetical protein AUEXF2481DRAFT_86428 [Aureobasidium subglaciale EXF-2481]|uniref:Pheromone-regulated membrane protein n=1 Tax=Aureobasidium subglaciale (strain EXF-2481) TaxID=1043005 RepID=A0A074YKW0_AURSE|nr:uncharacterized protein AUEXF2481DRAFT_86428 [Aureobasidium subglaciale EXF-2481]KAI5212009.1 hypothetical protein E4T38_00898 [Aureobasidium subglaciale]KAI5230704.1 hypothetical protein E4T40_00899 [Aureobasidium subglaciale]KAI5233973.1 hypothetical protein E4T41_00897 [Aureobasidium subglaciale]KAI5267381.1 hypothetical protein E4T46_00897 [Aureobasidium subglaciale]KEQ98463.1 hypothetical protein AUEXF2481DRAFT_86428 [Aureobasidium subglaciale EXF-2481]